MATIVGIIRAIGIRLIDIDIITLKARIMLGALVIKARIDTGDSQAEL